MTSIPPTFDSKMSLNLRLDRTAFSVVALHDNSHERDFWQTKTPQERLEALEYLRRTAYGHDAATARLQRVLEIAQREKR